MGISKRDEDWDIIFQKLKVLEQIDSNNYFDIKASQIKSLTGAEPRLMAKIDFEENLPKVFTHNKLSILAINNGEYRISKAYPFRKLDEPDIKKISKLRPPSDLISIDPFKITSESQVLDIANISGMLNMVFSDDIKLTIRGKSRIDRPIYFQLNEISFNVVGVQIEVDGGYEGKHSINLVEVKIGSRTNINLRQLLYPDLYWTSKVPKKYVSSYLLLYIEPYFRFIPFYKSDEKFDFDTSSEKLFAFEFDEKKFELTDIAISTKYINRAAPFPQADSFNKVLSMLSYVYDGLDTKQDLFFEFDMTERQVDYYLNVLKWMNLCQDKNNKIVLTPDGKKIAELPFADKVEESAKIVFSDSIFNKALINGLSSLKNSDFAAWKITTTSTIERRKQTIKSWLNFFNSIISQTKLV